METLKLKLIYKALLFTHIFFFVKLITQQSLSSQTKALQSYHFCLICQVAPLFPRPALHILNRNLWTSLRVAHIVQRIGEEELISQFFFPALQISLQVTILFSNIELRGKDQTSTAALHYKARERKERKIRFYLHTKWTFTVCTLCLGIAVGCRLGRLFNGLSHPLPSPPNST